MCMLLGPVDTGMQILQMPPPLFLWPSLQSIERVCEKFLLMPDIQMGLTRAMHPQGLELLFIPTLTPSGWKQE